MTKQKPTARKRRIALDPKPKGNLKPLTGAAHDDWNHWLMSHTTWALPINQNDEATATNASIAVYSGMIDMKPADPIEGILISQLMVAQQTGLKLYRLAWLNAEYFEASTRYLKLANNAARMVVTLTERLDHHRNRGQQQIVVQHTTTVNANQAVVTDSVVAGKNNEAASSAKLLAAVTDKPMEIIEPLQKEAVPMGGGTKAK